MTHFVKDNGRFDYIRGTYGFGYPNGSSILRRIVGIEVVKHVLEKSHRCNYVLLVSF